MRWPVSTVIAVVALVAAGIALWNSRTGEEPHVSGTVSAIETIDQLATAHAQTLAKLEDPLLSEPGLDPVAAFLAKIRRDGLAPHKDFKRELEKIAQTNSEMKALIDFYAPRARTAEFRVEADNFRLYATAWNSRWNSVYEYFMAGGSLPASSVDYPTGLKAAIAGELAAQN